MATVMVPSRSIVDRNGTTDLAGPTAALCRELNLMSPDEAPAIDLIKANALSLTKWVAGILGGGGALAGSLTGTAALFTDEANQPLKIALVAATGLILATVTLAVGWIVASDVRARAETQQHRFAARSALVHDYFQLVQRADFPDIPTARADVEVSIDGARI